MSALCAIDLTPATVGSLCTACCERLVQDARRAPELLEEVQVTMLKLSRQVAPGAGGHSAEQPLVLNTTAMEADAALRAALRGLAVLAVGPSGRVPVDAYHQARTVEGLVHVAARAESIGQAAAALERAVQTAWAVIDRAPDRKAVGKCGGCAAVLVTSRQAGLVRCRYCGREHDLEVLAEVRVQALADLVLDAAGVAVAVSTAVGRRVPAATVRSWTRRGQLVAVEQDPPGYRVLDALELWRAAHPGATLAPMDT